MSAIFSESLIKEYQETLLEKYGIFVDSEEAEQHLTSLCHTLFPTALTEDQAGTQDETQVEAQRTCAEARSGTLPEGGVEVGASITPDLGTN